MSNTHHIIQKDLLHLFSTAATAQDFRQAANHLFNELGYTLKGAKKDIGTIQNVLNQLNTIAQPNIAQQFTQFITYKESPFAPYINQPNSVFLVGNITAETPDQTDLFAQAETNEEPFKEIYPTIRVYVLDFPQIPDFRKDQIALITRLFNRTYLSNNPQENKLITFPVVLLIRYNHNQELALSTCHRSDYKRANDKNTKGEKLGKVSFIKALSTQDLHTGHLRILEDLTIPNTEYHKIKDYNDLAHHWLKGFDTQLLNKKFYQDISNWFAWATHYAKFHHQDSNPTTQKLAITRLLTRLVFCWFLKEKNIIPAHFFTKAFAQTQLNNFDTQLTDFSHSAPADYYKAILQNLFFATLNKPTTDRNFATDKGFAANKTTDNDINDFYRYENLFKNPNIQNIKTLFDTIPFLNGGLFDCLDDKPNKNYFDGFTRNAKYQAQIPDFLFFAEATNAYSDELKEYYKTTDKKTTFTTKGLFTILDSYKFTVEENTPAEEHVALDPELLGRIFENLLAFQDDETRTNARKSTGSFYTPREIVDYMCQQSLAQYLNLPNLDNLANLPQDQKETIARQLDQARILDPACGSGAYPMGILHTMVFILQQIDPQNTLWQKIQKQKIENQFTAALDIHNKDDRENRITELQQLFTHNLSDYGRKLYLIQNCIFGLDIQNIAIQISKLRFFLSLVIEQNDTQYIKPLPNLETKFVAANTLIGLPKPQAQLTFENPQIEQLKHDIKELRLHFFNVKNKKEKNKLRNQDAELRHHLSQALLGDGWDKLTASKIASFDPFNQNANPATWFDPEFMFGISNGFHIVIGNPPYVFARNNSFTKTEKDYFYSNYQLAKFQINLYTLFVEKSDALLVKNNTAQNGILAFIIPNNWLTINTNLDFRKFVLQKNNVSIVNFYTKVFETASVDSSILIYSKIGQPQISLFEFSQQPDFIATHPNKFFLDKKDFIINLESLKGNSTYTLLEHIEANSKQLLTFASVKVGLKTYQIGKGNPKQDETIKNNRVFHSQKQLNIDYYQYLEGKDVNRYYLKWSGEYLKYGKHLAEPRGNFNLFSTPRILVRQIPSKPPYCIQACYTDKTLLNDINSMNIIDCKVSPLYLLACLNSILTSFWFVYKFGKLQRGIFPQFKINELEQFPIPDISPAAQQPFITIVEYILYIKSPSLSRETKFRVSDCRGGLNTQIHSIIDNDSLARAFEDILDAMVFELYFPQEVAAHQAQVIQHISIEQGFVSFANMPPSLLREGRGGLISNLYDQYDQQNNPLRNAVLLQQYCPSIKTIYQSLYSS